MELSPLLERALAARQQLFDPRHEMALRLFNGFSEGAPELVVELYARTLLLLNYAQPPAAGAAAVQTALAFYQARLPWLHAVVVKERHASEAGERQGRLVAGERVDRKVCEHGIWYAVDLFLNQDSSLYLDTRALRAWAGTALSGKRVLNTFAYTGSLGVAAKAGGAARVLQTDLSRRFLNVAKTSYTLNGLPIDRADFQTGDFWGHMSRLKRAGERFDCVFLDPPFFSETSGGRLDLLSDSRRLINKLRPLVSDGGTLVAINNAVFLAGSDYMAELEALCTDGYVVLKDIIPVPEDVTGYAETRVRAPIVDPAPFNHSTKIALLQIRHSAARGQAGL